MSRIVRSKWFAVGLFAAMLAAAGAGAIILADVDVDGAAECVNCAKTIITTTADGRLDPASVEAANSEAKRMQEAYLEEGRQRALKKFNTWHGAQAHVPKNVPHEARALYGAVAQIFGTDLPAPEGRLREFAMFIEGQPEYKCVGWAVGIVSVIANENGWEATVNVSPELAKEGAGVLFTPLNTIERWQIAADGTATVIDVRKGDGPGFVVSD